MRMISKKKTENWTKRSTKDGTPTPLLAGRIEVAYDYWQKQIARGGKTAYFITSGGQGADEVISESAAMKNYLMAKGVDEKYILMEDKSTNTAENMRFSKKIIDEINPDGVVLYATTNYHVFRSGLYARHEGIRAIGLSAQTKWYFWPNAMVREFIGLLAAHRFTQIINMIGLIVCYVVLTWISYHIYY